jgi:chorismate mutase
MTADPIDLAKLRDRIDMLDAEMHRLLIERSEIIDALIAVKRTGEAGAAFRPGREASMMHALVARHRGHLPIVTVEHVWREIISTFTWLQAPYTVHVATGDAAETRDIARFYFGFTVPFETVESASDAITAVGRSTSDLAVIRLGAAAEPWWDALGDGERPRVIARLPFLDMPSRPVATPAVVVSPRLRDPVVNEVDVYAVRLAAPANGLPGGMERLAVDGAGTSTVVAVTAPSSPADVAARLSATDIRLIGGYAAPIALAS